LLTPESSPCDILNLKKKTSKQTHTKCLNFPKSLTNQVFALGALGFLHNVLTSCLFPLLLAPTSSAKTQAQTENKTMAFPRLALSFPYLNTCFDPGKRKEGLGRRK
jgi:hypothetical protein